MKIPPNFIGGNFAERTGLEPATSAVTGQHSNQLNYRSISKKIMKTENQLHHSFLGTAKISKFIF